MLLNFPTTTTTLWTAADRGDARPATSIHRCSQLIDLSRHGETSGPGLAERRRQRASKSPITRRREDHLGGLSERRRRRMPLIRTDRAHKPARRHITSPAGTKCRPQINIYHAYCRHYLHCYADVFSPVLAALTSSNAVATRKAHTRRRTDHFRDIFRP